MTALPRADAGDGWATGLVARWLDEFERGLATGPAAAAELFAEDAHWRDIVAFTWRIGQVHGRLRDAHARLRRPAIGRSRCQWQPGKSMEARLR